MFILDCFEQLPVLLKLQSLSRLSSILGLREPRMQGHKNKIADVPFDYPEITSGESTFNTLNLKKNIKCTVALANHACKNGTNN